jgi:hypothetical protein
MKPSSPIQASAQTGSPIKGQENNVIPKGPSPLPPAGVREPANMRVQKAGFSPTHNYSTGHINVFNGTRVEKV